jgi:predicted ATPase
VQAVAGFKPDPLHDLEPQRALQLAGDPKQVPAAAATVRGRKTARAPNVFFVVLTGGPCGGKTTSLNSFSQELSARGFDVYCAPETPTIMLNGGCKFPGTEGGQALLEFETALMKLQMQMEDSFLQVAHSTGRPSVIVLDRSLIDVAAYLQSRDWIRILKSNGWDERHFFDRYDLVVHLVTAAEGAEEYYTSANNTARRESPVEARTLDQRIRQCYAHHPRLRVIDNSTDFKAKVERATHSILELLHDGSH